jgi:hypothetical protein
MEPITLCGLIIVAFGIWVEFEQIIMKGIRAVTGSSAIAALLSPLREQRSGTANAYRNYRPTETMPYRMARS